MKEFCNTGDRVIVGAVSVVWRWQLTLDTELAIHWGDTAHTTETGNRSGDTARLTTKTTLETIPMLPLLQVILNLPCLLFLLLLHLSSPESTVGVL